MSAKGTAITLLLITGIVMGSVCPAAVNAGRDVEPVKIGVLAKRGKAHCRERWQPTALYLNRKISEARFQIVPLDFEDIEPVVAAGEVDFILANPSFYVNLEYRFGVDRMATLINRNTGGVYTRFVGVIFTRRDRADISVISDLRDQRFMAVKETSFGGWRMALRELVEAGVDPDHDLADLTFGGTHDAVVYAVRDRIADAGTVRSDTLERMAAEGSIRLDQFRVIPHLREENDGITFQHSTRAYPEWPMARVRHTPETLARQVAVVLMQMPADDPAANSARIAGWTIPLNYQPVHDCLRELRIGPYETLGQISPLAAARELWRWIAMAMAGFMAMVIAVATFVNLNRRLVTSNGQLVNEIDRRRTIAHALADAEQFNRSIISSVGEGIIVYDRKLRYRIWNRQMECITGLPAEDVIGNTPWDLFPHISQHGVDKQLERALQGETVTSLDTPFFIPPTGRRGWVVGTYSPLCDGNGEIIGVVAAINDITRRKAVADELKAANERFQAVMDGIDALVYVADMTTYEILYINPHGMKIWGDVTGKICWQSLQSGQSGPCDFCTNRELLDASGKPTGLKTWEIQNTVSRCWYECRDQAIRWTDGRYVRLEIATDITASKTARDQLVEQNRFMNHVMESLTHPFMVINVDDYTVAIANASVGPVAPGATCHQLTHQTDHPCGSKDHPCPVDIILETGQPTVVEHVHFNPDGERRHVEVHGYPIRDNSGRITKIIEYALDITERKRSEKALQEKEEYLQTIMSIVQTGLLINEYDTGRIVDVNPHAARLIGTSRDAIIGSSLAQYLPAGDSGEKYDGGEEVLLKTNQGHFRNVRVASTAACIRDRSYAVHSFMDVTDMRELIDQQVVNVELAKGLLDLVNVTGSACSVNGGEMALHIEAVSLPCRAAGGDHHFIRHLKGNTNGPATYLSLKDQSGHEVNCILRSIYTDLIHHAILGRDADMSFEEVVQRLNTQIVRSGMFADDDFFTAVMARIDHHTLDMQYAACGHPPFLLIRDDAIISLPRMGGGGQNLPLGTIEEFSLVPGRTRLRVGDRLLFYTDGLTEMPLEKQDWKISRSRLEEMVADILAQRPRIRVRELVYDLLDTIATASGHQVVAPGTNTSPDDVTLMGLEVEDVNEAEEEVLHPTDTAALCDDIRVLSRRISDAWTRGLPDAQRRVRTVLEEGVLNAWKNGHREMPGLPITVRWREGNRFHLQVIDTGDGFDPDSLADPRLLKNRFATSGRGIFMIRMAADEVRWRDRGRCLEVHFNRCDTLERRESYRSNPYDFALWETSIQ